MLNKTLAERVLGALTPGPSVPPAASFDLADVETELAAAIAAEKEAVTNLGRAMLAARSASSPAIEEKDRAQVARDAAGRTVEALRAALEHAKDTVEQIVTGEEAKENERRWRLCFGYLHDRLKVAGRLAKNLKAVAADFNELADLSRKAWQVSPRQLDAEAAVLGSSQLALLVRLELTRAGASAIGENAPFGLAGVRSLEERLRDGIAVAEQVKALPPKKRRAPVND